MELFNQNLPALQAGLIAARWVGPSVARFVRTTALELYVSYYDAMFGVVNGVRLTFNGRDLAARDSRILSSRQKLCPDCVEKELRHKKLFQQVQAEYAAACTEEFTPEECEKSFLELFDAETGPVALEALKAGRAHKYPAKAFSFLDDKARRDIEAMSLEELREQVQVPWDHLDSCQLSKGNPAECPSCKKLFGLAEAMTVSRMWSGRGNDWVVGAAGRDGWVGVADTLLEAVLSWEPGTVEDVVFPHQSDFWAVLNGPRTACSLNQHQAAKSLARWAAGHEALPRGTSPIAGRVEGAVPGEVRVSGRIIGVPGWIPAVKVGQSVRVGDELFIPCERLDTAGSDDPLAWLERVPGGIKLATGIYDYGLPLLETGPSYLRPDSSSAVYPASWLDEGAATLMLDTSSIPLNRTVVFACEQPLYREARRGLRLNMGALMRTMGGIKVDASPAFKKREKKIEPRGHKEQPVVVPDESMRG